MAEVEGILNGRPLTPKSDSSTDTEPLTSNHLLLLRPNSNLPPGKFEKNNFSILPTSLETGSIPCERILEEMDVGILTKLARAAEMGQATS